ncbi:MAG: hypothetical protein A2Y38_16215 [Spirochaetes bacterium GWB1_59_5]|nr:MAG: hypothetical protein A2Y38_16215 [Spirochaetes bacterium GWB1_59_5]
MMRIIKGSAILTSPTVPRFDEGAIEQTRDFNAPRAQGLGPEAFGAGVATGLQQVGKVFSAVAAEETAKADRITAIESRTKLDQAEVDLLYHPEKGALAKRGKDAFSLEEPTLKSYDERVAEIEGSLTRPEQKDTFRLLAGQRRVEIDKQIQRHVAGEIRSYADETNKASLESTYNNAIRFYNDPERVEMERKFGLAVIMSDTDNKGLPPEVIKAKTAGWESMIHKGIIERMSVDNAIGAKDYFEKNRDNIIPTDAAKMEAILKPLATKQLGMDTALKLAAQLEIRSLTEVLGEARTRLKSNADALNLAETQLKQMDAERKDRIKLEQVEAARPVYRRIAEIQLTKQSAKLSDIPAEEWANLVKKDPEEAGKIQDALRREVQGEEDRRERKLDRLERKADRQEREAERRQNKTTATNLTTWGALKLDPEALKQTNLDRLLTHGDLNNDQYKDLVADQLAIKQGKGEHEAKILSNKAAVDSVLSTVKIDSKKSPERYMKFYEALNTRMSIYKAENGKVPSQEEVIKLSRGLLAEVSQDRKFWFDGTAAAFEADPAKVIVPAADRDRIKAKLQSRKIPVTDEAIRSIYLEARTRGGK